jgi:hypothetical protein
MTARPTRLAHKPRNEFGLAFRRARRRHPQRSRTNAGVDFALCDIEADKTRLLWRHPTPFLARAGLDAHATVRVEGRRRTCPSLHHRVPPWGRTGSGPATGGCSSNRPFAHSPTICGHKGFDGPEGSNVFVARRPSCRGRQAMAIGRDDRPTARKCEPTSPAAGTQQRDGEGGLGLFNRGRHAGITTPDEPKD